MRPILIGALVLAGCVSAAAPDARARGPVVATLSLPYSTVLPGVPFDINVTLHNVSSRSVRVGLVARLVVTMEDGTEMRPGYEAVLEATRSAGLETSIRLGPGQRVHRGVSWSPIKNWTHDPRYSGGGTYQIALEITTGERVPSAPPLRSSSARLVRRFERPEDEVVWKRMTELTGGQWSDGAWISHAAGRTISDEILASHRASGYYPYALVLRPVWRRPPIETSLETAARFPDSPAHAYLMMQAAGTAFGEAGKAHLGRDSRAARELYGRAAELYEEARHAKSIPLRILAEQQARMCARAAKD